METTESSQQKTRPWQSLSRLTAASLIGFVTVLIVSTLLIQLGQLELFDPDEARYVEVSREMVETGEYLIPQLDYEARVEKPPLYHWMLAGMIRRFGATPFATRLPSVLP